MMVFFGSVLSSLVLLSPSLVLAQGIRKLNRNTKNAKSGKERKNGSSDAVLVYKAVQSHNDDIIKNGKEAYSRQGRRSKSASSKSDFLKSSKVFRASKSKVPKKTSVIVGGAGWSGVSLTKILDDANVDFILLEATDDIGGRMRHSIFGAGEGYSVELGAQWIDGIVGSPSWKIAEDVNLGGSFQKFDFSFYNETGDRDFFEENYEKGSECLKADTASDAAYKLALKCLKRSSDDPIVDPSVQELCNKINNNGEDFVPSDDYDITEEDAWLIAKNFKTEDEPNPANARVCQAWCNEFSDGLSIKNISAKMEVEDATYYDFGKPEGKTWDYWVGDPRGFAWLPKTQAASFLNTALKTENDIVFDDDRLQFHTKITKIEWDPKGKKDVKVSMCKTKAKRNENGQILFPCLPGKKHHFNLEGNEFVSTFSNQVLKKSFELEQDGVSIKASYDVAPRFVPPLSSIDSMGDALLPTEMGLYTKLFFQFTEKFWPSEEGQEFFLSAASGGDYVGDFAPVWSNFDREGQYPGSKILMLYTLAERATELAKVSDEGAMNQILPVLSAMFRDEIVNTFGVEELTSDHVSDFLMTRWTEDPLFYGGFEAPAFGMEWPTKTGMLAKRYGNLVFSGSYSCRRHSGYTHGALLAGERTAW
eukprot:CAMPEP_0194289520 /NCGR_PEP_ID=MMETSP0169-20130528/39225_1 /TAXON_ID=218684 /ORGANISM="Corethron pennatum, Strain L29A3" /LENGTH=646 /DNA_ID=CAMNT_0039036823 /DNA_START=103 /DNA_END=2040 /DNA_ORIENTATION=+